MKTLLTSPIFKQIESQPTVSVWGPIIEVKKTWIILERFTVDYHWRSKENVCGRFGGGWDWEFGIQIGSSIILNCLIFYLRISKIKLEV